MKKVIVFSNMYPSTQHPTFGIFVKNQVDLLQSAGLDVEVVAIQNPGKGKVRILTKYMTWFACSMAHLIKKHKQISLTHAHYAFPTGLLSLLGKSLFNIPYVVTVHGGDIDKMAVKSQCIVYMTKRILQQAETVIVAGEKLREDVMRRFDVVDANIHVMSMGVDTSIFNYVPREEAREQLSLPKEDKMILFVGNIIRAKGLLELVEAFDMLRLSSPDSSLYIIGSQKDSHFVEELQSLIEEKDAKNIHIKEPLGQAELSLWMSASDTLVLPSHHEGFGLVALEAMSAGTKVVATDVGGLSYLLKGRAGVLVEVNNPDSLAQGMWSVLDEESAVIDEAVVQARIVEHSFDAILEKLLTIYRSKEKV